LILKKILLIDHNHFTLEAALNQMGFVCEKDFKSSKQEIEQKISDYFGIVIRSRFKIDRTFLDAANNLKFIARVGAGLESIDIEYAKSKGIQLFAAPEGNRNAVGEHALGMLLSMMNHLNRADHQVRKGVWNREGNRGVELDGKTVGIIGYGNMGKAFAKKLRGFDIKVLCHDLLPNMGDENATQVPLKVIQQEADILSIHTDDNPLSRQMVNREFINVFAKPFYFINTARGSAVKTEDLVEALQSGKIVGAALDVLEWEKTSFEMAFSYFKNNTKHDKPLHVSDKKQTESSQRENLFENETLPPAFEFLIHSDRVLLTPHIAGWTVESKIKLAEVIVEKIRKFVEE
jgi:D-3-phosphoglycerate dehydrogenase